MKMAPAHGGVRGGDSVSPCGRHQLAPSLKQSELKRDSPAPVEEQYSPSGQKRRLPLWDDGMAEAESVARTTLEVASTSGMVSGEAGSASRAQAAVSAHVLRSRSNSCLSDDVRKADSAFWKGCSLKGRKIGSKFSFSSIPTTTQMSE